MADGWQTFPVEFSGGLVTDLSPIQQGTQLPGSARQLRNFEPSVAGGYRRITGYKKYSDYLVGQAIGGSATHTGKVRGVHHYGTEVIAVRNDASGNGDVIRSTVTNGVIAWESIGTLSVGNKNTKVRFCKYNFDGTQRLVVVDGHSQPAKYTTGDSSLTPITSSNVLGARHVTTYRDHLVFAKEKSVVFSTLLSDSDFTPATGALEYNFKDTVTGLEVFRDTLYIFTNSEIHSISGTSSGDFVRKPVSIDMGCVREDTIQEIAGDVVFMAPDGLRLLSGTERIGDIGLGAISKTIQKEATEFLNLYEDFCSVIIRGKSQYRVFGYLENRRRQESDGLLATQFGSQGEGNIAWAELRGIKAFCAFSEYTGTEEIVLFGNEDGYVYQMEKTLAFDGDAIPASFFTPYYPMGDPTLRKTIYVVHNYIDPDGNFQAKMRLDYDFGEGVSPDPITITNGITSTNPIGRLGTDTYTTWEADGTADVDGQHTATTNITLTNTNGTIEAGQYVSGNGIVGTPTVVSINGNDLVLSSAQTLSDATALSFSNHSTATFAFIYGDVALVKLRDQATGSGFVVSVEYTTDSASPSQEFTVDALALEYAMNSRR